MDTFNDGVKLLWEDVSSENGGCFSYRRAKVPGGWLVEGSAHVSHVIGQMEIQDGWDWRPSLVFVPDPSHSW